MDILSPFLTSFFSKNVADLKKIMRKDCFLPTENDGHRELSDRYELGVLRLTRNFDTFTVCVYAHKILGGT